jgi:hypothetical protein
MKNALWLGSVVSYGAIETIQSWVEINLCKMLCGLASGELWSHRNRPDHPKPTEKQYPYTDANTSFRIYNTVF